MEVLIRDKSGLVHRRFQNGGRNAPVNLESDTEDDLEEYEIVDESDLPDISIEAWCKHCFEMTPIDEVTDSV